jgi:hypothetical protein
MLASTDGDEEDNEGEAPAPAAAVNDVTGIVEVENFRGRSEEDAIALSDDEDEEVDADGDGPSIVKAVNLENNQLNPRGALPNCQIYRMWLRGPQLGVEVGNYKEKLVVSRKLPYRVQRLGEGCKPDVGDILVAVGEKVVPPVTNLDHVLAALRDVLRSGEPAEMWFAEDPEFKKHYEIATSRPKVKKRQRDKRSDGGGGANNDGAGGDEIVVIDD